jgi:hypothetical protein
MKNKLVMSLSAEHNHTNFLHRPRNQTPVLYVEVNVEPKYPMNNILSSYDPLQQLTLTRFGRLKMLQRDVLPQLPTSDFRVKLTLKALYSTYQDLQELGLDQEAKLLLEPGPPSES